MSAWGAIYDSAKSVATSKPANELIGAGIDAGKNKLLEMSGFEDPQAQSPAAPIAAPTPPPEEQPKRKMPTWVLPVAGVSAVALVALLFIKRGGK